MKNTKPLLIIMFSLLTISVSFGSSKEDGHTYQDSDQLRMEHLMNLLIQKDIPFESIDGMIRYNSNVKVEFEKTLSKFDSGTIAKFKKPEVRNYFHSVLFNEGIEYIESERNGGSSTLWWPGTEERRMNILDQVIEYKITLQMEEDSDCETDSSDTPLKRSFIKGILNNRAEQ